VASRRELRELALLAERVSNQELAAALRRAALAAERTIRSLDDRPGIGAHVRRAQLRRAALSLRAIADELWSAVGEQARRGILQAADLSALHLLRIDASLGLIARGVFAEGTLFSAARAAEAIIARRQYGRSLSERVYHNSRKTTARVLRIVEDSLGAGRSADEIARLVRRLISPSTPGGVSYAARRLARTEIANAYHNVAVRLGQERPWVEGFRWNLSGSHPRADVCDSLAERSPYAKREVPARPHPQCLCVVTVETVSRADFIATFNAGGYDAFVTRVMDRARMAG
jgi:hypothetical protein